MEQGRLQQAGLDCRGSDLDPKRFYQPRRRELMETSSLQERWAARLPGLGLAFVLAVASMLLATSGWAVDVGVSALTVAIVVGILLGNMVYPMLADRCDAGVDFAKGVLLRLGIILFGFRITFQDVAEVGFSGVGIAGIMLATTFGLAVVVGHRWLRMDWTDAILIGAGASICGAAAVLATEPVVKAKSGQVVIAVATVVVFGTIAMFLYPLFYVGLERMVGMSDSAYGVYVGSTVHEVAQVVVAGASVSDMAAGQAVITKMVRVMMLAPFLLLLSFFLVRLSGGQGSQRVVVPWFAVWFLVVAGVNSLVPLPEPLHAPVLTLDTLLLAMAMGALGLTTHVSIIRKAGFKPLLLAFVLFVWLVVGGGVLNAVLNSWL